MSLCSPSLNPAEAGTEHFLGPLRLDSLYVLISHLVTLSGILKGGSLLFSFISGVFKNQVIPCLLFCNKYRMWESFFFCLIILGILWYAEFWQNN